ncbi:unnamed protein product, partial [Mesorhabditis belari]|uniref:Uncharacterized protein n=1 Tax=Mesorhabditis belari TaxID=2138241 RepID=A0AAF3ED95_9BILA
MSSFESHKNRQDVEPPNDSRTVLEKRRCRTLRKFLREFDCHKNCFGATVSELVVSLMDLLRRLRFRRSTRTISFVEPVYSLPRIPTDTYLHTRSEKIRVGEITIFKSEDWANFLLGLLKSLPLVTDRDSVRVIELGKGIKSAVGCTAGDFRDKLFGLNISTHKLEEQHQYPVYGDNGEVGWVRYEFVTLNSSAGLNLGPLEVGGKGFVIKCIIKYVVFESFDALEEAYKEMKSGR